ncbi:alpha/beta fold hydrolase [Candidatus Amesbacteria bacterium]|nr:alpha/beta fold hydrolase [Candidatus Amesbacteria bacterium]
MKIKVICISILLFFHGTLATILASSEPFSSWSSIKTLPYTYANTQLSIDSNRLFTYGATVQLGDSRSYVKSVDINNDGSLGNINSDSANMIEKSIWHSSVTKDHFVYILGGTTENSPGQPYSVGSTYFGQILNNKILSWTSGPNLNGGRRISLGSAVRVNDKIYLLGGATWTNGGSPVVSSDIFVSTINPDGSLSSWSYANKSMPTSLFEHGAVTIGNKIILVGGSIVSNSSGTNKVWSIIVNSDGSLNDWQTENNLPFTSRRAMITIANGYLVHAGGVVDGNISNQVWYTSIDSSGNLGSWATPTPTPTPLTPVIVLPGMGGSWNYEALVHNTAVADSSWSLTPLVTVYDGLITTLKNSGYTDGTDLWVYYYDWRKSISDTASNLASFITSKNLTSVNLLGHSQGGLIARLYAQNNPAKINKLITIASPHAGALPAFKIWEGADFSDLPSWQSLLVKLYLRLNRKSYANDVTTIQSKFPNLQNILPTFEYFNSGTGTKSNFLSTLTNTSLYTISGTNLNTPKTYTVTARGTFDKLLGRWANGKPIGVTNAPGDGTVLLTSGQITNSLENSAQDNQDHQALVSNSTTLAKIQSILGISGTVSTSTQSSLANALIVTVASPVNFTVTIPTNSTLTPTDNLLIVNNPSDGNYTVNITPSGAGGAYIVYFGKIKDTDWAWEEASGNITSGTNTHVFGLQMSQAGLGSNPLTNALSHTNDALAAVGSNAILKQDVLRIRSYVNDLNIAAANNISGFDLRAGRLFSAVDTLTNKAKNTSVTESMRLLKSDVEQLRGDRFGN